MKKNISYLTKNLDLSKKLSILISIAIGLPIIIITQVNVFLIPREEKKLIQSEIAVELKILEAKIDDERQKMHEESTQLANIIEDRNINIDDPQQAANLQNLFNQFTLANTQHSFY